MNIIFQRMCAAGAAVSVVLFFAAFVFTGFIPPRLSSLPPEDILRHYQDHTYGILGGMALMFTS